jgi:hypothetical protein
MLSMRTIMGECLNVCIKPERQNYLQNPRKMSMSLRNNITPSLDVTPSIQTTAKKSYKKPSLSSFGKVSSVTASGSGKAEERGSEMNKNKQMP